MAPVKKTGKIGGGRPGPGRPKGVPNRRTAKVADALWHVYNGMGADDGMLRWAKRNKKIFYAFMFTKMLPRNLRVAGPDGGPLVIVKDYTGIGKRPHVAQRIPSGFGDE